MPYGKTVAILEETENGNELVIRVKLPNVGEPAKSGRSDNLTDPNEWIEVCDEYGASGLEVRLTVAAPYRRTSDLESSARRRTSATPRLSRRSLM